MNIKDNLVSAFIKGFVISKAQIFDNPGFIVFRITGKTDIYTRQLIFPEDILVNFEKKLIDNFGEDGKQILYSIGKKWGYRFAAMQNFTKKSETKNNAEFLSFVNIMNTFIGGTYAESMKYEFNFEKNLAKFELGNFVVVRKLGFDYFLALGGATGLWCYLLERNDIEGVQVGSAENKIFCEYSIPQNLGDKNTIFIENNLSDLFPAKEYRSLNAIVPTKVSKKSFSDYLKTKIFTHVSGSISLGDETFFLFEASGMYLLEKYLKDDAQKKILFDVSFESGKKIINHFKSKNNLLVGEFWSALGWGEVIVLEKSNNISVIIEHFPWTKFFKDIDFIIFRGLLSGMLSEIHSRKIFLSLNKKNILFGLSLNFSEE